MPLSITSALSASAALGIVLGLVLLAAGAARRFGFARGDGERRRRVDPRLTLLDTLTLDRVRRVHLVRCDGRSLVIMTGAGAEHFLGWLPGDAGPKADPGQEGRP